MGGRGGRGDRDVWRWGVASLVALCGAAPTAWVLLAPEPSSRARQQVSPALVAAEAPPRPAPVASPPLAAGAAAAPARGDTAVLGGGGSAAGPDDGEGAERFEALRDELRALGERDRAALARRVLAACRRERAGAGLLGAALESLAALDRETRIEALSALSCTQLRAAHLEGLDPGEALQRRLFAQAACGELVAALGPGDLAARVLDPATPADERLVLSAGVLELLRVAPRGPLGPHELARLAGLLSSELASELPREAGAVAAPAPRTPLFAARLQALAALPPAASRGPLLSLAAGAPLELARDVADRLGPADPALLEALCAAAERAPGPGRVALAGAFLRAGCASAPAVDQRRRLARALLATAEGDDPLLVREAARELQAALAAIP